MATVFYFDTKDLIGLLHPRRFGNYFNEPDLLQGDIRGFLQDSGQLEWADKYSTEAINWGSDFRQLLKDFIENKGLDYEVLERWCSRSDYGAIDKEAFSRQFPPKVESIGIGIRAADVAHWWIKQWDSSEKIELGLVSKTEWPLALSNLFFPFLFYNFHALYAKAIGYKYLGGYCRARKCENLYLVSTTGSLPKFCDPVCRNRENVNLFREKQRGEIVQASS